MSRGRFALLLSLLCLVVATASFAIVLSLLDDDTPVATDDTSPPTDPAGGTDDGPAATSPIDDDGVLDTPAFVAIVASEGDEAAAQEEARSIQEAGYPAGFLLSDDFESLTPGFWVAFAGPYTDVAAANAAIEPLAGDGFPGAYVRCVGTAAECG